MVTEVRTPGKTVLVPLTNSLYVPGELSDVESVIVDVGTGYFVDKVYLYVSPPDDESAKL